MASHWQQALAGIGAGNGLLTVLAVLGAGTVLSILFRVTGFIYLYLRSSGLPRYLHATDGKPPWALVTGASDGVGTQFAHELAAQGFNVVLHGRNATKLETVRDELRRAFPARSFRMLVVDASLIPCACCDSEPQSGAVDFEAIGASLSDINLTVLINNAGAGVMNSSGQPTFHPLHAFPQSTIMSNVNLNAIFPMLLLRQLIPQLIRNAPSLAINIGSMADLDMPLMSFYGPSKTFSMGVAGSVGFEMLLDGHDVEVLGVRLGEVTGVSHYKAAPTLFAPSARTMARAALDKVGCGRSAVIGYWGHALQQAGAGLLPYFLKVRLILDIMRKRREDEMKKLKAV